MKARKEDVSMLVYEFSERAEVIVANVFTSFAGGVMHASERIRQVAAFRPVLLTTNLASSRCHGFALIG